MAKVTPKIIYYRDETAQKLIGGINAVADVVKVGMYVCMYVCLFVCMRVGSSIVGGWWPPPPAAERACSLFFLRWLTGLID